MSKKSNGEYAEETLEILANPKTSYWLRSEIIALIKADNPIEAKNDAVTLARLMQARCDYLANATPE